MRADDIGFFWERMPAVKEKGIKVPRSLPPTPDTGWMTPRDLPDLRGAKRIAVDLETKDTDLEELGPGVRRGAHIIGIAVGTEDGGRWYLPMRHEIEPELNLDPDAVMRWAKDQLEGSQDKVGANLLYDADFLAEAGVQLGGRWLDVQIAEPLLDENRRSYALDVLGHSYFGEGKVKSALEDWVHRAYGGHAKGPANLWRTSPRLAGPYAEGDVDLPLRLLERQEKALAAEGLGELWRIETDLLPMLLAMRRGGVRVDMARARVVEDELTQGIDLANQHLKAFAGFEVNVNASSHLVKLFTKAGVAYPKTDKGNPSFTKEWLEHTAHPACEMIMQVRKLTKYRDTFIRGYIYKMAVNGRIHCLFHSMRGDDNGTVSGRFSSSLPNLQNIPVRDKVWGPKIRSIFIPEEGMEWLRHDWSQIEYRFLAHFGIGSNGEEVRQLYRNDPKTDFHVMVMNLTGLERKPAKNTNFGLVYGMGTKTLAASLGMGVEQAKREVFDAYHAQVPFVKMTYDRASQKAETRGYVLTFLKRRARFDLWGPARLRDDEETTALPYEQAVQKWGTGVRRAFTHKALNRVLQGSAADLMKKAMVDIWRSGVYQILPVPHLTVHDELDHSKPRTRQGEEAAAEVKRLMEVALPLKVPVLAEEERGPNWGECH